MTDAQLTVILNHERMCMESLMHAIERQVKGDHWNRLLLRWETANALAVRAMEITVGGSHD